MSRHHKVHELLTADELAELEAFAREPGRTIDECHQWLLERGYTLSRGAVGNWKQKLDEQVMSERMSRNGELARAMKAAVEKDGGFDDVANAALLQLVQVTFEQSSRLEAEGKLDPIDVMRMTRSLRNLIGGKAEHTKTLAAKFDREMDERQKKRPGGALTAEDILEARRQIFGS